MEMYTDGNAICGDLISALQQAVAVEKEMDRSPVPVPDSVLHVKEIAVIELSEYMARFTGGLNLQNVVAFLGREVLGFSDALYVILELRELIEAQLTFRKGNEPLHHSRQIIHCCHEFALTGANSAVNVADLHKQELPHLHPANF